MVIVLALVASGLGLASPATAAAQVTYVTMVGTPGEWVSGGKTMSFSGSQVSGPTSARPDVLSVNVSDGANSYYQLWFAAPKGEELGVGHYPEAERADFRSAGHPGIDISGSGRGCNTVEGAFTVHDLVRDTADPSRVTGLSIDYDLHCEGGEPNLTGHVRVNQPPEDDLLVTPESLTFDDHVVGTESTPKTVTLINQTGAAAELSTSLSGDFVRYGGTCGATLAHTAMCTIGVRFAPSQTGQRTGTLTTEGAGGAGSQMVRLDGTGTPVPVQVAISSPRDAYRFDEQVPLTVTLSGGFTSRTVAVYRTVQGGSRTLVTEAPVGDDGTLRLSARVTERTTFTAVWAEGTRSAQADRTVDVRAAVSTLVRGHDTLRGRFHVFSRGKPMKTIARVAPHKATQCVAMEAQFYALRSWHEMAIIDCLELNATSRAAAYLGYERSLRGQKFRFRTHYAGDARNLGSTSSWVYTRYRS